MIELSSYQLNSKIGEEIDVSQIKVIENNMEVSPSNYRFKVEGGQYSSNVEDPNKFTPKEVAIYKLVFIIQAGDGTSQTKECIIDVEDVAPEITIHLDSPEANYNGPNMVLPPFTVNHPAKTFGTGRIATSVRLIKKSLNGGEIEFTVMPSGGSYSVNLLEFGVEDPSSPFAGDYTIIYKAASPTGKVEEKKLPFSVDRNKPVKIKSHEGKQKVAKNRINLLTGSMIVFMAFVIGIFTAGSFIKAGDDPGGGNDTDISDTTNNGNTEVEGGTSGDNVVLKDTEESTKGLMEIDPEDGLDLYELAENYIRTANSYLIKYTGSFYGSKEVLGKTYTVAESVSGKTKKHNCVYYSLLDVTKNHGSNFGGNIFIRTVMPDSEIVLNQMNKSEKVFDETWIETPTKDFSLFLNRKGGVPYIKVNGQTIRFKTYSGTNDGYEFELKLDPNAALSEYRSAINSIFKIFIDDFSYNVDSLVVSGSVDKYGRPKSISYNLICDVSVTYKGIDIDIENANLNFTETFSNFNGVNVIEDEYVRAVG